MRKFEKISFNQFKKDLKDDNVLYEEYKLPIRKTKHSAGYDFLAIEDIVIKPKEIVKFPTGTKVSMEEDEVLLLVVRSSIGFKYNVRLINQVGVIDSDYYNNVTNEGHMWCAFQNEGDNEVIIKKGEGYMQGIFTKFLITDNDNVETKRTGGIGSTTERKN